MANDRQPLVSHVPPFTFRLPFTQPLRDRATNFFLSVLWFAFVFARVPRSLSFFSPRRARAYLSVASIARPDLRFEGNTGDSGARQGSRFARDSTRKSSLYPPEDDP